MGQKLFSDSAGKLDLNHTLSQHANQLSSFFFPSECTKGHLI